jgi:uncharacterized membrane protein YoaK (UPF0700 family)
MIGRMQSQLSRPPWPCLRADHCRIDVWREDREKVWLAVSLAWVAGFVDAVGYVSLFRLFIAHMSGNSAAMGAHFGQGEWGEAFYRAFPIPVFVLGVIAGAALHEAASRRGVRFLFSLTLGLEAALLFLFMICGEGAISGGGTVANLTWEFYLLVALPAFAMGLQNAALRRAGGRTVRTTYVTGWLTDFAEDGVEYLYWLRDRRRGAMGHRGDASPRRPSLKMMLLGGGIWLAFVTGAITGGYAQKRWELRSLLLPLSGLALIIALDRLQPIHAARRENTRD